MGSDLREVTASLRKSLGGDAGEQRMDEILENIRQLTADTREMVRANREDVDATITNFRAFSDTLKTELPRLAEKLNAHGGPHRRRSRREPRQPQRLAGQHQGPLGPAARLGGQPQRHHREDQPRRGLDRQAGQRRGDRRQPQHHAEVGRERRGQPEEHDRPRRAVEARHERPQRGAPEHRGETARAARSVSTCTPPTSASSGSSSSTRRSAGVVRRPRPSRPPSPTATARRRPAPLSGPPTRPV